MIWKGGGGKGHRRWWVSVAHLSLLIDCPRYVTLIFLLLSSSCFLNHYTQAVEAMPCSWAVFLLTNHKVKQCPEVLQITLIYTLSRSYCEACASLKRCGFVKNISFLQVLDRPLKNQIYDKWFSSKHVFFFPKL